MKRWIRLGAVVVAIAAMVVAIVVLRSVEETPTDEPASVTTTDDSDRVRLLDNPREEIARIEVVTDESTLTIAREEGDEGEPIFEPVYEFDVEWERRQIERIVSGASSVTSRRVIGEVDNPAEFGLDDPSATITVTREDGTTQTLEIGAQTPARNAFYVTRPDDPNVYSVFATWIRPFLTSLDALRVRSIPQIAVESLQRIEIDTLSGRQIRVERIPEWDEDPELGFSTFAVVEPYQRRYQLNTTWLEGAGEGEGFLADLAALEIGRYVDDSPVDLGAYGLASPAGRVLIADDQTTLEILVGAETEGGRFATFASTPSVFVLSGAEALIDVQPYETISPFALIINIELVNSFTVTGDGVSYTGSIERTPVEGEDEPQETFFLNGEEIDEEIFRDLYQWAIGMQFDAELPPGATTASQEPLASITYFLNNDQTPLTVRFVPYNANFAAVVRGEVTEFIVSRAKVNRMLAAFEEAAGEL